MLRRVDCSGAVVSSEDTRNENPSLLFQCGKLTGGNNGMDSPFADGIGCPSEL
jgi:hypothetical protein